MAGGRPAVSVVIPTRDRSEMLRRAVASVLAQRDVDLEVVVVDDGSGEPVAERLEQLRDPRVRVIRHETSRGVARARNAGVEAADGEWVAFLDDDDFWAPQKLARHLERARAEGAGWVYGAMVFIDPEGRPTRVGRIPAPQELHAPLRIDNVVGGPSSVAVRASLLERTGCFDERLSILADWDLWLRLEAAERAAACHEPLVGYAHHAENMQLVRIDGLPAELDYLAAKHSLGGRRFGRKQLVERRALTHRLADRRVRAALLYLRAATIFGARRNLSRALGALAGERLRTRLSRRRALPRAELGWIPETLAAAERDRPRRPEPGRVDP
jgi:glycosyltransferase involved in cell wall biosynthesis